VTVSAASRDGGEAFLGSVGDVAFVVTFVVAATAVAVPFIGMWMRNRKEGREKE
jgi:hypothetical protein